MMRSELKDVGLGSPLRHPVVSILIVGYNSPDEIRILLESLRALPSWSDGEVLIAENGDRAAGEMESLASAFGARLLFLPNPGFGTACNRLAELASGRYLLLANPDLRFDRDILPTLADYLDAHPDVGAVGPRLVDMDDGILQMSLNLPMGLKWEFLEAHGLQSWWRRRLIRKFETTNPDGPWEVGLATAACVLIRPEVFRQVGGFDEDFFLNSEDIDLCDKIRDAGWKIHVLPRITAIAGTSKVQSRDLRRFVFDRLAGKWVYIGKRYTGVRRLIAHAFLVEQICIRLVVGFVLLKGLDRMRLSGYFKALKLARRLAPTRPR
jgi:GT2 family glycosyltransferase